MVDPYRSQRLFFEKLASSLSLAPLFEYLPEVYLYVKDRRSRFVKVNEALWRLRGCESEAEMLGLCDLDIHPKHLAEQYIAEDRRVMQRLPAAQPDLARSRQGDGAQVVHFEQDSALRRSRPRHRHRRRDARP